MTNIVITTTTLPITNSGTVTGMVFTTTTLPITNYRYRKSMNMEADFGALYQAYIPIKSRKSIKTQR